MLQQMLKERDTEVQDLRARMVDDLPSAPAEPQLTPEQQTAALSAATAKDVEDLRAFIEQYKLLEADPLGEQPSCCALCDLHVWAAAASGPDHGQDGSSATCALKGRLSDKDRRAST